MMDEKVNSFSKIPTTFVEDAFKNCLEDIFSVTISCRFKKVQFLVLQDVLSTYWKTKNFMT